MSKTADRLPPAIAALDPGWQAWLIENKQRGCANQDLLKAMV